MFETSPILIPSFSETEAEHNNRSTASRRKPRLFRLRRPMIGPQDKKTCICIGSTKQSCIFGLVGGVILTIAALYMYNSYFWRVHNVGAGQSYSSSPLSPTQGMEYKQMKRNFPDVIIVGVRKGGTKALITVLDLHPQIQAARGEVHFFDRTENYAKGIKWYLSRMPLTDDNQLTIEKSPSYFVTPNVPERIFEHSKTVKLLLIVRDPVTRAISDYAQLDAKKTKNNVARPTFEKAVFNRDGTMKSQSSAISVSLYDVHFQRWLKVFPRDQFLIVDGDAFISDPFKEIVKVERFLNVDSFFKKEMFVYNEEKKFYCWRKLRKQTLQEVCLGSSKGRAHPDVNGATKDKLSKYFQPHNENFCSLANMSYSWCTP